MKKLLALILALCLPCAALAETVTANGVVKSAEVLQITAPYSGVLLPFEWESGDSVAAGDQLFALDTQKIYAPADGTLVALFAEEGDLAENVLAQYGMLASIEKTNDQLIDASTSGAYADDDNKIIHVGETVYFEQTRDRDNEGMGRVIAVNDSKYTVELIKGEFDLEDQVRICRDENMSSKSCIGSGTVKRAANVSVGASGRVLRCAVQAGEQVRKGQLLFEMASLDADAGAEARINADCGGSVEIACVSGQQVYRGQLLAKVHDLSVMEVVAEVDEMDLDLIRVGDHLTVTMDRYGDQQFTGTVTEIAGIGMPRQNAAYYSVTIRMNAGMELLPGMNATVWLSGK